MVGYRRGDVEAAIAAWGRALAEAESTLESRKRELAKAESTLESREREVGWQRKQIDELDRVATRLAELVVAHKQDLGAVRAELAEERERSQADPQPEAVADDPRLGDKSAPAPGPRAAESLSASEAPDRKRRVA